MNPTRVARRDEKKTSTGPTARIKMVGYAPDGKTLATVSSDSTVRIWDADSGAAVKSFKGHKGDIEGLAYSPDGRRIATSGDSVVIVCEASSGKMLRTLLGHEGEVDSVEYSRDGKTIVSGGKGQDDQAV